MLTLWAIGHFIAGVATGVAFCIWLDSAAYPKPARRTGEYGVRNGTREVETTDISRWGTRFYESGTTYAP